MPRKPNYCTFRCAGSRINSMTCARSSKNTSPSCSPPNLSLLCRSCGSRAVNTRLTNGKPSVSTTMAPAEALLRPRTLRNSTVYCLARWRFRHYRRATRRGTTAHPCIPYLACRRSTPSSTHRWRRACLATATAPEAPWWRVATLSTCVYSPAGKCTRTCCTNRSRCFASCRRSAATYLQNGPTSAT